jgi:hypothetical protein
MEPINSIPVNCSTRYKTGLDKIPNLHFQPGDIYSYHRINIGSSAILSPSMELLQCRDGSSSGGSDKADIWSIIDSTCTS